jgi:hypothetical protein
VKVFRVFSSGGKVRRKADRMRFIMWLGWKQERVACMKVLLRWSSVLLPDIRTSG